MSNRDISFQTVKGFDLLHAKYELKWLGCTIYQIEKQFLGTEL